MVVLPDGATVSARYHEPRKIIKVRGEREGGKGMEREPNIGMKSIGGKHVMHKGSIPAFLITCEQVEEMKHFK